jgi:hypothetical protein
MEKEKRKAMMRDYNRNLDKMTSHEPSFLIVYDYQ